jgi:hypothetical protein
MAGLDLQALSDHEEIHRALSLYTKSIDRRDYPLLEQVFAADAVAIYGAGNVFHGLPAIRDFLAAAGRNVGPMQHLVGSIDIALSGDRATVSSYLQGLLLGSRPGYAGKMLRVFGEYRDEFRRTPAGLRISRRELLPIHLDGDPALMG